VKDARPSQTLLAATVIAVGLSTASCGQSPVRSAAVASQDKGAAAAVPRTQKSARSAPEPQEADGRTLTLVSYNVNYKRRRLSTVRAIRELDADVVFLQETTPAWQRYLRFHLGGHYPHVAFHHSRGAGGLAVLSRYPFHTKRFISSAVGKFPAWQLVVQGPFGPVQVLNLHLRPIFWRGPDDVISRYYRTQKTRILETRAVLPHIDRTLPTVLLGDFNEDIGGTSLQLLVKSGYCSAARRFTPAAPTWRWKVKGSEIRWQLDHILHGPRLQTRHFRIFEAGASDHFPLLSVLALRPPSQTRPPGSAKTGACL
jgi:endonuclease/exonuclease/phosphatase family metal-dependent hydrolase